MGNGEIPDKVRKYLLKNSGRISRELGIFSKDARWFNNHEGDITREYPDMFVAVYRERVVGSGEDMNQLVKNLHSLGYTTSNIYVGVTYAKKDRPTWILGSATE